MVWLYLDYTWINEYHLLQRCIYLLELSNLRHTGGHSLARCCAHTLSCDVQTSCWGRGRTALWRQCLPLGLEGSQLEATNLRKIIVQWYSQAFWERIDQVFFANCCFELSPLEDKTDNVRIRSDAPLYMPMIRGFSVYHETSETRTIANTTRIGIMSCSKYGFTSPVSTWCVS